MKFVQKLAFVLAGLVLGHVGYSVAGFSERSGDFTETVKRVTQKVALPATTVYYAGAYANFTASYPTNVPDADIYPKVQVNIKVPGTVVASFADTPTGGGTYGISFTIQHSIDSGTSWYTLGTPILLTGTQTLDALYLLSDYGNMVRVQYMLTASAVPAATLTITIRRNDVYIGYATVR